MTDEEREWVEQWGSDLEKRMLLELDAARALLNQLRGKFAEASRELCKQDLALTEIRRALSGL